MSTPLVRKKAASRWKKSSASYTAANPRRGGGGFRYRP
jgi:hypothetical protein